MDYKTAGVDVTAGRAFVERIKSCVEKTHKSEVIGGLGGFGGCIRIPKGFESRKIGRRSTSKMRQMCFKREIVDEVARLHENCAYSMLGAPEDES